MYRIDDTFYENGDKSYANRLIFNLNGRIEIFDRFSLGIYSAVAVVVSCAKYFSKH